MNFNNKTILITGGAGFVGSHLVDRLIKEGYKVIVVDNLSNGKKKNINWNAKFYKISVENIKISQIFKNEKPTIVFHYAAQIDVQESIKNPIKDANINILGTLNILENCKKFKVRKIIFPSSVGVYGESKTLPVEESYPLSPVSPYPITKLTIEKYLNFYETRGLDFVSLRYSNIYGPRQLSTGEGGVVAIFIDTLLNRKSPVIYGSGKQTRDFLYIDDAVEAGILAMKISSNSIYNVGTNKEISINSLFNQISDLLRIKNKPIFRPLRQGEIIKSRINYSKIKKEIDWQPKYSLEKGLKETIQWFKSKHNCL